MSKLSAYQKLLEIKRDVLVDGDFSKFARTYFQDSLATQAGDLGWINPGETLPEFERAINMLQDGQISEPIRSEYGYYLIQVLRRREIEMLEKINLLIRQTIGQRKAEQVYIDWLPQLRDTAFVEYKINIFLAQ